MASSSATRSSMSGGIEKASKNAKGRHSLSSSLRKTLRRGLSSRQKSASHVDGDTQEAGLQPAATILSGWMVKCGGRTKTWKRRWFVLDTDNLLTYYNGEELADFMGFIDVNTARRVIEVDHASHKHCFAVETDARSWMMSAQTNDERKKWMAMLSECLPPQENVSVDLEGLLWKTGRVNKSWRQRHFCLTGRYVAYFKLQSDLTKFKALISSNPDNFYDNLQMAKGYIPLSEAKLEDTGDFDGRQHCIAVKVPGRVYRLSTASRQEATLWMRAMRQRSISGRPSVAQGYRLSTATVDTMFDYSFDRSSSIRDAENDEDIPISKCESDSDSDDEEIQQEVPPIV